MSAPQHNRHRPGRQLRLERCEDRALLSGDAVLGDVIVPVDTLTLTYDSAYIAQDRNSISVGGMNFYDLNATTTSFTEVGASTLVRAEYRLNNGLGSTGVAFGSGIWTTDSLGDNGYNADQWSLGYTGRGASHVVDVVGKSSDYDLDFTGASDSAGVLISPQIPIIPSIEETGSTSPSPTALADTTPAETISLASVLRSEPVARQAGITHVAQSTPIWNAALEKPAFLQRERSETLSPEAIETLDRAFALEGLELEATSVERPSVNPNGEARDASLDDQPVPASVRLPEDRPAFTQTSLTLPTSSADPLLSDDSGATLTTSDDLAESVPPTWPAYLVSKARQTGLALTLGTVAIAIRLRWQRAEQELPQRSPARKFPHA